MKKIAKTLFFLVGLSGAVGFVGGILFTNRKWTEMMSNHMEWLERMVELSEK